MPDGALSGFDPLIVQWFEKRFSSPTEPQVLGWPEIRAGNDVLISAPTGSGKTLAAGGFALHHARAHQLRQVVGAVPYILKRRPPARRGGCGRSAAASWLVTAVPCWPPSITWSPSRLLMTPPCWFFIWMLRTLS